MSEPIVLKDEFDTQSRLRTYIGLIIDEDSIATISKEEIKGAPDDQCLSLKINSFFFDSRSILCTIMYPKYEEALASDETLGNEVSFDDYAAKSEEKAEMISAIEEYVANQNGDTLSDLKLATLKIV